MKFLLGLLLLCSFNTMVNCQNLVLKNENKEVELNTNSLLYIYTTNDSDLDWNCTKCQYSRYYGILESSSADSFNLRAEFYGIPSAINNGRSFQSYTYNKGEKPLITIAKSNVRSIIDYKSKKSRSQNKNYGIASGVLLLTGIASGITASLSQDKRPGYIATGTQLLASFTFGILAKRKAKKSYEFIGTDDDIWTFK